MQDLRLEIDEMHCGACVRRVDQALRSLPGVRVDEVAVGSAMLGYDEAQTTEELILRAVVEAGYPARLAQGK